MRASDDRGQATVELALCLPLVALLVAAAVEVVLLGLDQMRLWHAAREAARVAVVDPDQDAAMAAARRVGLDDIAISVDPHPTYRIRGRPLRVELAYRPSGHVPLIRELIERIDLRAEATMRIEEP